MRLRPPTLFWLYLLAALGGHVLFPEARVIPTRFVGAFVLGAGVWLMVWAVRLFERKGTTHKCDEAPTALVTTGPFRLSRNPMVLPFCLMLLGVVIFAGTLPAFLAPLAFFWTMQAVFIPHEERELERVFGQEYLDCKSRVRRSL